MERKIKLIIRSIQKSDRRSKAYPTKTLDQSYDYTIYMIMRAINILKFYNLNILTIIYLKIFLILYAILTIYSYIFYTS